MDLFTLCFQDQTVPFLSGYRNVYSFSNKSGSNESGDLLHSSTSSIIEVTRPDGSSFFTETLDEVNYLSFSKIEKKEAVSFSSVILEKKPTDFDVLFGPSLCFKTCIEATLKGLGETKPSNIYLHYPERRLSSRHLIEICGLLTDDGYALSNTYCSNDSCDRFLEFKSKASESSSSLNNELQKLLGEIKGALRFTNKNTVKQIENFISVSKFLSSGAIPLSFHDWPISPDIAMILINLIDEEDYDLVLETGSGTSTFLISKTLEYKDAKDTKFVSLEHDEKYRESTLRLLKSVDERYYYVSHSPLSELKIDNQEYSYYSISNELSELLLQAENFEKKKVLLFVDGPPGKLNKNARYPIVHLLEPIFDYCKVTIVLDDANRTDEKNTVNMWCRDFEKRGLRVETVNPKTEKGCIILKIEKGD